MIDKLPPELIEIILLYLTGTDFLCVRLTCRTLKDVVDVFEVTSNPSIWRWFILGDFPRPCVESAAPWFYLEVKNALTAWKTLYADLRKMASLPHRSCQTTHLVYNSRQVHSTQDVKFVSRYLFLVDNRSHVQLLCPIQTSCQWPPTLGDKNEVNNIVADHLVDTKTVSFNPGDAGGLWALKILNQGRFSPCDLIKLASSTDECELNFKKPVLYDLLIGDLLEISSSTWTTQVVCFDPHTSVADESLAILCDTIADIDNCAKQIEFPVTGGFHSLDFNDKWIVTLCQNQTICISPNQSPVRQVQHCVYPLPRKGLKVKLMGDIVLVLFGDGVLETAQIVASQPWTVSGLCDWRVLVGKSSLDLFQLTDVVTDFVVQGLLLVAVKANGALYLSSFETLDQNFLHKNVSKVHQLPVADGGCITRMAVDVCGGLKLALVETSGLTRTSRVHVLYLMPQ